MAINTEALKLIHPAQAETLRAHCDSRARVLRDPDATATAPHANSDAFGLPVKSNARVGPPTGAREIDSYDCTFKVDSPLVDSQNGRGEGGRNVPFCIARVGFLRHDNPDVRKGDTLVVGEIKMRVTSFDVTSAHSPWLFALGQTF